MGRKTDAPGGRRAFTRQSFEMHVEYVVQGTNAPEKATLYNLGAGGMYFETRKPLSAATELSIRLVDYSPDVHGEYEFYRGRVAWSGQVDRGNGRRYGVGVRFLEKGAHAMGPGRTAAGARFSGR